MSDKGDVYYCSWKQDPDGTFIAWEIAHPTLRAHAKDKGGLIRALGDVVGEYYDDHEPALEFDPPLSADEGDDDLFADGFTEVVWNQGFTFRPSRETAFTGGRCKRCGGGLGPRSSEALVVDSPLDRSDGAFSAPSNEPPPCHGEPGHLMIVSAAFLRLLTPAERACFVARPLAPRSAISARFFEIVPGSFIAPASLRGRDRGWRCALCDRRHHSHQFYGHFAAVICRSDLPAPAPPCFLVGTPIDTRLCIHRGRWEQLRGQPGTRKLLSSRVAVADESKIERNPDLPTLDERAAFRR